jgi:hypothetical protein
MTSPNTSPDDDQRPIPGQVGLIITNLTKLAGLVVVVNEALFEPVLRPEVIGIAALMMAGAQGLESFLRSFFGK